MKIKATFLQEKTSGLMELGVGGTYLLEFHSQELGKTGKGVMKTAILPTFTIYAIVHGCPCKFDLKKKKKEQDFSSIKIHKHIIFKCILLH